MEKETTPLSLNQLRAWWFPAVVVVVIVLGSFLVLIPQINRFFELRSSLLSSKASLVKLQAKVNQVSELDEAYIGQLAGVISFALPEHKPYYEMFSSLQQLAGETGVQLGDFDLNPGSLATNSAKTTKVDKKGYISLDTAVNIRGTTDQVVSFIDSLQRSLPLVIVTSISVSGNKNESDMRQAQLDMTVNYVPDEKKSAKSTESTLTPLSELDYQLLNTLLAYSLPRGLDASSSAFSDFNRQDIFSF